MSGVVGGLKRETGAREKERERESKDSSAWLTM